MSYSICTKPSDSIMNSLYILYQPILASQTEENQIKKKRKKPFIFKRLTLQYKHPSAPWKKTMKTTKIRS